MPPLDKASNARREYPLTTGRRISQSVLAAVFLFGAGFFLKKAVNPIGRDFVLAIGGISLILGILVMLQAWSSRLVLDGDRIELHSIFRTHIVAHAEIEGLRKIENQYGRWTRVYLKQGLGSFSISNFFVGNEDLQNWLKGLPDLDKSDADEITNEVSLRESPTEKRTGAQKEFRLAKTWAIGLSVLAGVASAPVIFVSYAPIYEASLVVLLVCPIVGIFLLRRFPLLFTAFGRKPDPRADLGFLLIWPGVGVMLSYQTSNDPTHLVDILQLIYWALAVLVCLLVAVGPTVWKRPSRWALLLLLMITGGMYSVGLANSVDTLLDHSVPYPYETWVLKKTESHSSKGTRYFLRVAPWGPMSYSDDVDVPMRTYERTHVGDPVCYGLHPGFLHARWYASIRCVEHPASSAP